MISKRRTFKIGIASLLLVVGVLGGLWFFSSPVNDVRWVYVKQFPGESVQPLFPDRDEQKIKDLLKWVREAKEVPDEKLTYPSKTIPVNLTIVMKNGDRIDADFAYSCSEGTCKTVKDHVTIVNSSNNTIYAAKSPEFFQFLNQASRIHRSVKTIDIPTTATVGRTFRVEGNEWLTDKVTVQIKKGDQVFLSSELKTVHGHFSLQVICPDVELGRYSVDITGENWGSTTGDLEITR